MFPDLAGFAEARRQGVLDLAPHPDPDEPVFSGSA
jgi:hypothetical protein